jgi:ribosomal-protein-alanine N-acetyltransferase
MANFDGTDNVVCVFTLRDYTPNDFEALYALDQKCFAQGIAYTKQELKFFVSRRSATTIVATAEDEQIAGFLIVDRSPQHAGHIITIDVAESARRTGLGTQLMNEAERRMQAAGCKLMLLEVAVDNLPALGFYRKHGYERLRDLPHYYSNGVDGILMGKGL